MAIAASNRTGILGGGSVVSWWFESGCSVVEGNLYMMSLFIIKIGGSNPACGDVFIWMNLSNSS